MKSPVSWMARGLFLLAVLAFLVAGLLLARAASWKADAMARLEAGALMVETLAGPAQYATEGTGEPVLVLHGAGGGYDQALELARAFGLENHEIFALSRPGYLGTPLKTHILPEQQASFLASFLDVVNPEKVSLLACGESAMSAVEFALRNPTRVNRLVLVSPVLHQPPHPSKEKRPPVAEEVLTHLRGDVTSAAAAWLLQNQPEPVFEKAAVIFSPENTPQFLQSIKANPDQSESFREYLATFLPISPREPGLRNDILQVRNLPLIRGEALQVPLMIVQGSAVPAEISDAARGFAGRVPGGIFVSVEGAGFLPWLGPDGGRAAGAVREFLSGGLQR